MQIDEKAVAARRAYNRAYYRQNREKIRQQQNEYWKRKANEMESAGKGPNNEHNK